MDRIQERVSIRRMRMADADEIGTIHAEITHEMLEADFKRLVAEHVQRFEDVCLVAELDGRIVGFMVSYILTLGFGVEKSAWIATMGVHPKYMGQGIGAKLAREVCEIYQTHGISNVYTSVHWDAVDHLSFFKTLGFDRSSFINLNKTLE